MTTTNAMNVCPICSATPKLSGWLSYQVRCDCGACGPKQRSQQEAVSRWNSVVHFVQKFRASGMRGPGARYKPALC